MSGRKCSKFRLQREREEKLRLLQTLNNLHAEVNALKERLATVLADASEGLRSTFVKEVKDTQQWLNRLNLPDISRLSMDTDLAALNPVREQLEQAVAHGRRFQETLTVAFTKKADEMGQRLAKRLAEVERFYLSRQQLLRLWFEEEQTRQGEQKLRESHRLLDEERYAALEQMLAEIEKDIAAKVKFADEQENKHQKRLYLLKALRQVCAEMGFEEVSKPRYEQEGDRGSRILLTVDTLDRGRIAFTLSLDGISSFSEIADDRCFEEFGQLSQYLEEEFGIETKFRLAEGEPAPKLKQKGELDLPQDAGMQARA
ncbi:hypothetical protein FJZ31_22245 [Candidatus Poribacteria bacterium]|nr:hypothetical protein [Candidatus Poribacteria bacterium]